MWDEQPCMILISVRPLANPSLTSPVPFISCALQGEFWCTASWEWAAPPLWCWRTSWSTATSRSNGLCRSWSRREPSTPTGISWLCCWIWTFSWPGRRKRARSCDPKATPPPPPPVARSLGLPGDVLGIWFNIWCLCLQKHEHLSQFINGNLLKDSWTGCTIKYNDVLELMVTGSRFKG